MLLLKTGTIIVKILNLLNSFVIYIFNVSLRPKHFLVSFNIFIIVYIIVFFKFVFSFNLYLVTSFNLYLVTRPNEKQPL